MFYMGEIEKGVNLGVPEDTVKTRDDLAKLLQELQEFGLSQNEKGVRVFSKLERGVKELEKYGKNEK